MDEIKKFIDDLGIVAFENSMNIAGLAVVADSGTIVFQTDNWDLTNQTNILQNIMKGESSITLSNTEFSIIKTTSEGIIATNSSGMGHVILVHFQGGVLLSYAMPQADPAKVLTFLKPYAVQLNGKV
jgi:hypothetical protein